jgi:hypothetical protein
MPAPQPHSRLQIATRIHLLLLREVGQGVVVEQLLARERYARDVLMVCDALRGSELAQLAADFRQATALGSAAARTQPAAAAPAAAPGHVLQPTDWSADTSGFHLSRPPERAQPRATGEGDGDSDEPPAQRPGWLQRLRGG